MPTRLRTSLRGLWLTLSDVPGWPDAPLPMRLRRLAPILVALAGIIGLLVWQYGWRRPEMRAVRAAHAPLVALEEEIASLARQWSDQQATELAARARAADAMLLASPADVPAFLRHLREEFLELGWDAVFQAYDTFGVEAGADVQFVTAQARLTPTDQNARPFPSLLHVIDRFSAGTERIDLTRLGIRADEPGRLEVEVNLRIACRVDDEETS